MSWIHLVRNLRRPLRSYLRNPRHVVKNIRWRWNPSTSSERHIFVVGAPRSGTTLMQMLIGNHPKCVYDGETGVFKYRNIFEEQKQIFGLDPEFVESKFRECSDIVEFFDICARNFKNLSGGKYLVEKSPAHIFRTRFLIDNFVESFVVHIYRDGRDCFCSARSASIPHGDSVEDYAKYWNQCVRSRLSVASDRIVDVAYESLVEHPEKELKRIMQIVGLSLDEQQLSVEQRAEDPRAQREKFDRLGTAIDASSQGRWVEELDRAEVHAFERIAGQQLKRLGYKLKAKM